jgi:hypothetical protein
MKLFTKQELIDAMRLVFEGGWQPSVKNTIDIRNDGAVGNTLENLLGIDENNLPIPNATEWELKGQRLRTASLITLKHTEPSPQGAQIVSKVLLPKYGWKHKQAGIKYPLTEMSFRSTTSALSYTNRGFGIVVDEVAQKLIFDFDYSKVDVSDPGIAMWFESVKSRAGLGKIAPEPYWAFGDLKRLIGTKMTNCFYVVADSKMVDGHEWFKYEQLYMLSGFSFDGFLNAVREGSVLIDFDARTGHNHGTKFRLHQKSWARLYSSVIRAL